MLDNPVTAWQSLTPLNLQWLPGKGVAYKLADPYRIRFKREGVWRIVTVPKGFDTDLASIPFGFRNLFSRAGRLVGPSIPHDYMYQFAAKLKVSRLLADWVLLAGLTAEGLSWWRRWAVFLAVRAGGWWVWRRHKDGR